MLNDGISIDCIVAVNLHENHIFSHFVFYSVGSIASSLFKLLATDNFCFVDVMFLVVTHRHHGFPNRDFPIMNRYGVIRHHDLTNTSTAPSFKETSPAQIGKYGFVWLLK